MSLSSLYHRFVQIETAGGLPPVASLVLLAASARALFVPANLAVLPEYEPLFLTACTGTCRRMFREPGGSYHSNSSSSVSLDIAWLMSTTKQKVITRLIDRPGYLPSTNQ